MNEMIAANSNFTETFNAFVVFVNEMSSTYTQREFPNLKPEPITVNEGKRYNKLVKNGSAFCFVDTTNGNILKAAGWSAPAKGARGNIFNRDSWKRVTPYGAAYLR